VIEEVKQNVSTKTQRPCGYMNLQNKNIRKNGVNRLQEIVFPSQAEKY